jgi:hypothetical protein
MEKSQTNHLTSSGIYGDSSSRKGIDAPAGINNEGRLKPPYAGIVVIALVGARRLISRPEAKKTLRKRPTEIWADVTLVPGGMKRKLFPERPVILYHQDLFGFSLSLLIFLPSSSAHSAIGR